MVLGDFERMRLILSGCDALGAGVDFFLSPSLEILEVSVVSSLMTDLLTWSSAMEVMVDVVC